MAERVNRAIVPAENTPRVKAGMTRCAGRADPRTWEPLQAEREQKDEEDTQKEVRQCKAQHREAHDCPVEYGIPSQRSHDAGRNTDEDGQKIGGDPEEHGRGHAFPDYFRDRTSVPVGLAEFTPRKIGGIEEVLRSKRAVESPLLTKLRDLLVAGIRPQQRLDRIARCSQHHEGKRDDEKKSEEGPHRLDEPKAHHCGTPPRNSWDQFSYNQP